MSVFEGGEHAKMASGVHRLEDGRRFQKED